MTTPIFLFCYYHYIFVKENCLTNDLEGLSFLTWDALEQHLRMDTHKM